MAAVVAFKEYHEMAVQYQRYQRLRVLSAPTETISIRRYSLATGGGLNPLQSTEYHLLFNGKVVAKAPRTSALWEATFTVDMRAIPAGWVRASVGNLAPGETCPTWFYFHKPAGSTVSQSFIPVVRGTYEMQMAGSSVHMWVKAPPNPTPKAVPLQVKRSYLPPDPKLARSGLHCEYLVPMRWGDVHRPNRNKDGIVSSFDNQNYTWSALHAKLPTTALLDGPRGVGAVGYATHLQVGNAVVDGVPRNNTYFCDPWRVGKISEDGTITTLVGYRHKNGMLNHYEDADVRFDGNVSAYSQLGTLGIELIGDWSSIPESRRGFWELWGMAWDERTLILDESRRIASEQNEHPHVVGPVMFVADSQHNRICKVQFSATQHGVPPVVTEFILAQDPWDCVCENGVLFVSERKSHRICAYDATTGKLLRVVVQGLPLASINDQIRRVTLTTTLDAARAAPCVAPEGLFLQDGWLYFASKAQAQVRRVRLDGSNLQVVRPIAIDAISEFAKLAVSDGTFGPRGSTFTWTWSNAQFGGPEIYSPDGVKLAPWWNVQSGGTGWWGTTAGYGTCGAAAHGRLVCANMTEGVYRISRSETTDRLYTDNVNDPHMRGKAQYHQGLHLLHGHNGYGFYGLPLPWGVSSDIDAYLTYVGHVRP